MIKVYVPRQRMREILQNACASLEGSSFYGVDELYERALIASDEIDGLAEIALVESSKNGSEKVGWRKPSYFNPTTETETVKNRIAAVNERINGSYEGGRNPFRPEGRKPSRQAWTRR